MEMAFVMGVLASYWFLAALLLVALVTEYNDAYISTALITAVGLVTAIYVGHIPYWVIFAYIPVGIVWSFWRWNVYCKKCTELAKEGMLRDDSGSWKEVGKVNDTDSENNLIAATNRLRNLDRIIAWIVCFPVSMVESVVDDFIHILKIAVTEWLDKIYKASTESALKDFRASKK